jgi:hypothetical protein
VVTGATCNSVSTHLLIEYGRSEQTLQYSDSSEVCKVELIEVVTLLRQRNPPGGICGNAITHGATGESEVVIPTDK